MNLAVFSLHPNLIYYFSGQITAHFILTRRILLNAGKRFQLASFIAFVTFFTIGQYFTSLYTVFGIISERFVPIYMVVHKIVWTLAFVFGTLYFKLVFGDGARVESGRKSEISRKLSKSGAEDVPKYSFWTGMTRLTFSLYFVNYFVIRTHFFNSRQTFYRSFYDMTTTVSHVHFTSVIVAFVFHLIFVAPFENLRKKLV